MLCAKASPTRNWAQANRNILFICIDLRFISAKSPLERGRTKSLEDRLNVYPCWVRGVQCSERRRWGCVIHFHVDGFLCISFNPSVCILTHPLPLSRGESGDTKQGKVLPLQGADAKGASVATTADLSAPRSLAREHYEGVFHVLRGEI